MIKMIFKNNQTTKWAEKKIAPDCGFLRSVCGKIALGLRIRISQKCMKQHVHDPDQDLYAWTVHPDPDQACIKILITFPALPALLEHYIHQQDGYLLYMHDETPPQKRPCMISMTVVYLMTHSSRGSEIHCTSQRPTTDHQEVALETTPDHLGFGLWLASSCMCTGAIECACIHIRL